MKHTILLILIIPQTVFANRDFDKPGTCNWNAIKACRQVNQDSLEANQHIIADRQRSLSDLKILEENYKKDLASASDDYARAAMVFTASKNEKEYFETAFSSEGTTTLSDEETVFFWALRPESSEKILFASLGLDNSFWSLPNRSQDYARALADLLENNRAFDSATETKNLRASSLQRVEDQEAQFSSEISVLEVQNRSYSQAIEETCRSQFCP